VTVNPPNKGSPKPFVWYLNKNGTNLRRINPRDASGNFFGPNPTNENPYWHNYVNEKLKQTKATAKAKAKMRAQKQHPSNSQKTCISMLQEILKGRSIHVQSRQLARCINVAQAQLKKAKGNKSMRRIFTDALEKEYNRVRGIVTKLSQKLPGQRKYMKLPG